MASFSNLQDKVDRAVVAYLISASQGSINDTYPVANSADKSLPCTIIETGDGTEEETGLGLFRHSVTVTMKYPAALPAVAEGQPPPDSQTQMKAARARAAAIIDVLRITNDQSTLDYTAQSITAAGRAMAVDQSNGADPDEKQSAQNNADLADFTIHWWECKGFGSPKPSEDGSYFVTEALFECVAGAAAVDITKG